MLNGTPDTWSHDQAWDEYLKRCRKDKAVADTLPKLGQDQDEVKLSQLVGWHKAFDEAKAKK